MPFANVLSPSLGLGLLKGALAREGIPAKTFHFQFKFAKLLGEQWYAKIHSGMHTEHLAGEYIFSPSLFPEGRSDAGLEAYVENILRGRQGGPFGNITYPENVLDELVGIITGARAQVEGFLEECLEAIAACRPRVVGFTSLFHQHVASLALARRLKDRLPETFIVLGGSNCEGPMGSETLRQFGFVDAVVSGEGDTVFTEIVRRVLNSEPVAGLRGVFSRVASRVLHQPPGTTTPVEDLDALPIPNYDEYFEQLGDSLPGLSGKPSLLFETSRGCWWGEKHHCTFCGLNGETMKYRSKSAARAFSEFAYLTEKYPGYAVDVVDNILDMSYFNDFIPLLAGREHGVNLFYEVKANLKKEQLRLLKDAGVVSIQPGIESFSDGVLRIMRKGVSALQNIQLLKWCKELGINAYYNVIWGFPGESEEHYAEVARLLPLLTHLEPPVGWGHLRIDRFSPNFDQAAQLGFTNVSPHPAYRYVYPLGDEALANLAYFFTAEYEAAHDFADHARALADELHRWKGRQGESDLFYMEKGERLLVWDLRPIAKEALTVLTGWEKFAYVACDQSRTARQVANLWREHSDDPLDEGRVRGLLDVFTERGLMVRQEDLYLALAYCKPLKARAA